MRVRLGYVAIALNIPKTTSSSNVTYTHYKKTCYRGRTIRKIKNKDFKQLK